ncbi:uncharacterized protein [Palaemon carinicauda]|uniref:uncharacterized protein n=1 Tax=Palaemon carinicauda TaxID=392227 RepID=UPI0035B6352A
MTSVANTSNGVAEEKAFDSFNVSQGKEALDLASEDSFQSIGSLPSADTQSNSDSLDTPADLSGESSLPSPDSAIGGTPGLTPDLEFHSPIGKVTEEKVVSERAGKNALANAATANATPENEQTVVENVMAKEEDDEDADTPEAETASTASSSSSSLLVMEKEDRLLTDSTQIETPTQTLIDCESNTEKSGAKETASIGIMDTVDSQPINPIQEPLVPSAFKESALYTTGEPKSLGDSPKESQQKVDIESPGKKSSLTTLADVEEFIDDILVSGKATAEKRGNTFGTTVDDSVRMQVYGQEPDNEIEKPMEVSTTKQKIQDGIYSPKQDHISETKSETVTALPSKAKASTVTDPESESAGTQRPDLTPETPTMALDKTFAVEFAGCPIKNTTPLTTPLVIPEIKVEFEDDSITEDKGEDVVVDTTKEEDKSSPAIVETKRGKDSPSNVRKKIEQDDDTEEEEYKKATPVVVGVPPVVKNDKVEDGGYEEDEEEGETEEEDDLVLSDSEMVVEASMKFPLANKANLQEEQKQSDENPSINEPTSEVAVDMNVQVTQITQKEATPSGCESDIEDNDEYSTETEVSIEAPVVPSEAPALAAPINRVPASLELPETVVRLDTPQGSSVFLVGTAHFSRESQDDVANTIRAVKPDIVVVELCKARTAILQLDEETILEESRSLDFRKVQMILRQHGKVQGILYLLLLSVSAHITKQLGMAPGGEFRTAFAEARHSAPGCLIQFGDRPIQVTLSRALASLSLWHKIKLTWHILTSKEPISKEEVEKCKQRDFIEEMLAEMTGQFPAISEVFVKERDIYLCRSLQAAAQPVPNPMSPSGIAPRIVVGVVGIGHVPGIVERWGKVTDEDIPPIMMIPPTSLSTHVLKFTLRVTFYGLLGYGVYKCLPSSAKSSVQSSVQSVMKVVTDTLPQKWLKLKSSSIFYSLLYCTVLAKSKMSQGTFEVLPVVEKELDSVEPQSKRVKAESNHAADGKYTTHCKDDAASHSDDDYEHVQSGLVYVITSFPGASLPHYLSNDYIEGCKCGKICNENCQCLLQHGCPYEIGKLKKNYYDKPIFECNEWCNCSNYCPNRVVQRGPVTGLKVLPLPGKGHGVVSSYFIPRNSFVCEYAGEYISVEEACLRFSQQSDKDSNYILILKEHFLKSASGPCITIIDPTVVGNIGRYINHSCNPNLVVVPVRINSMLPHAAFFAVQDILPGEELCYDYSSTVLVKGELPVSLNERKATGSADSEISQEVDAGDDNTEIASSSSLLGGGEVLQSKKTVKLEGCRALIRNKKCLEPNVSSSYSLKPCHCKSENCRKFLPADKDIF